MLAKYEDLARQLGNGKRVVEEIQRWYRRNMTPAVSGRYIYDYLSGGLQRVLGVRVRLVGRPFLVTANRTVSVSLCSSRSSNPAPILRAFDRFLRRGRHPPPLSSVFVRYDGLRFLRATCKPTVTTWQFFEGSDVAGWPGRTSVRLRVLSSPQSAA